MDIQFPPNNSWGSSELVVSFCTRKTSFPIISIPRSLPLHLFPTWSIYAPTCRTTLDLLEFSDAISITIHMMLAFGLPSPSSPQYWSILKSGYIREEVTAAPWESIEIIESRELSIYITESKLGNWQITTQYSPGSGSSSHSNFWGLTRNSAGLNLQPCKYAFIGPYIWCWCAGGLLCHASRCFCSLEGKFAVGSKSHVGCVVEGGILRQIRITQMQ